MNAAIALRLAGLVYSYAAFHIGNQYITELVVEKMYENETGKKVLTNIGDALLKVDSKIANVVKKSINNVKIIVAKTNTENN